MLMQHMPNGPSGHLPIIRLMNARRLSAAIAPGNIFAYADDTSAAVADTGSPAAYPRMRIAADAARTKKRRT